MLSSIHVLFLSFRLQDQYEFVHRAVTDLFKQELSSLGLDYGHNYVNVQIGVPPAATKVRNLFHGLAAGALHSTSFTDLGTFPAVNKRSQLPVRRSQAQRSDSEHVLIRRGAKSIKLIHNVSRGWDSAVLQIQFLFPPFSFFCPDPAQNASRFATNINTYKAVS